MSRYGCSDIQRLLSLTQPSIKAKTGREVEGPWMTLQKFQDLFHLQSILEKGLVWVQCVRLFLSLRRSIQQVDCVYAVRGGKCSLILQQVLAFTHGEFADVDFCWPASPRFLQQSHQKQALLKWRPGYKNAFFSFVFIQFTWNSHCCLLRKPQQQVFWRGVQKQEHTKPFLSNPLMIWALWVPFQVTETLLLEEGESVGLASWTGFHPLRTQAKECIYLGKYKRACEKRKYKIMLEKGPRHRHHQRL